MTDDAGKQEFPYIAMTVLASGIHPSTSRIVTIDAITFDDDGEYGEVFHAIINPGTDPGPTHQHGLTHEDVDEGKRFSAVLKKLDALCGGRTLVVHNAPRTWGFIVAEARRAMTAAARANRSRSRGKNRPRRRKRVGHVPTPKVVIDTLATARRQAIELTDTRLAAVAAHYGMKVTSPVASVERSQRPADEVVREQTEMLIDLFFAQGEPRAERDPKDLRADRVGLQRSNIRVDAIHAPHPDTNPGVYKPGTHLVKGMEVVVAPEIEIDPNEIIEAIMDAGLVYSEKLTRDTSLVVCNCTTNLRGKAMHAHRKGIPLMSDTAFLHAAARVREK